MRRYDDLPRRPAFLAPPLRITANLGAEVLTLHTIQTREAYETLVRDSVLVGDPTRGDDHYQEAYGWMLRQMDRRLPGPREGMLWLWSDPARRTLRELAKRARRCVLLTVRVHRERVLLSEFSDWHAALNRSLHVPLLPGETDEEWEARWTRLDDAFDARVEPVRSLPLREWPADLRSEIELSWEAIFDPTTWRPGRALQATTRELHVRDVLRAVRVC